MWDILDMFRGLAGSTTRLSDGGNSLHRCLPRYQRMLDTYKTILDQRRATGAECAPPGNRQPKSSAFRAVPPTLGLVLLNYLSTFYV